MCLSLGAYYKQVDKQTVKEFLFTHAFCHTINGVTWHAQLNSRARSSQPVFYPRLLENLSNTVMKFPQMICGVNCVMCQNFKKSVKQNLSYF